VKNQPEAVMGGLLTAITIKVAMVVLVPPAIPYLHPKPPPLFFLTFLPKKGEHEEDQQRYQRPHCFSAQFCG
jgi:hypothetical protein